MPDLTEKTLKRNEVYAGRIIRVRRDEVLLPGGGHGLREVVEHPGGVGILLLLFCCCGNGNGHGCSCGGGGDSCCSC